MRVDRPYQEWEMDLALAFDNNLQCLEWELVRDLAIFYQMTLASVPSLVSALDGGATAPVDHVLSANEVAKMDFTVNLFNPPTKMTVQIGSPCTLLQRHPNKVYTQASLTHPKLLCPALPYLRFGLAMENEILSTPVLPDFDFSLTQHQAESLLSILNCPGALEGSNSTCCARCPEGSPSDHGTQVSRSACIYVSEFVIDNVRVFPPVLLVS